MRIGLLHGYELTGSGSNEYVRYLAGALAGQGHEVHVLCRDPDPPPGPYRTHLLPHASVRPVYLTDKQRCGNVKAFSKLSDAELDEYHAVTVAAAREVLKRHPVDILHANHLVYQPVVAAELGVPYVIYPHGSSIEYTLRHDPRLKERARAAIRDAAALVSGNREVLGRILALYPEDREAIERKSVIVGVGVDTSLFRPRPPGSRPVLEGAFGGKSPELVAELAHRLDAGDFDAVRDYHEAYAHGQPDADLGLKLARIPWEERRVILFVGALTAAKGVQSVIAALPRLLPAHLVVVGSGTYRETLEALVHAIATGNQALFDHLVEGGFDLDRSGLTGCWQEIGGECPHAPELSDHVHFLGRLDHDLLHHVFPCAAVAVFPSVVPEAYPLVLMESLSNGVLPAVSDFSGFKEGLDALAGLLDPALVERMRIPMDPATRVLGIVQKLTALLESPTDGEQLHRLAEEHFDWGVRARQMAAVYENARSRKA